MQPQTTAALVPIEYNRLSLANVAPEGQFTIQRPYCENFQVALFSERCDDGVPAWLIVGHRVLGAWSVGERICIDVLWEWAEGPCANCPNITEVRSPTSLLCFALRSPVSFFLCSTIYLFIYLFIHQANMVFEGHISRLRLCNNGVPPDMILFDAHTEHGMLNLEPDYEAMARHAVGLIEETLEMCRKRQEMHDSVQQRRKAIAQSLAEKEARIMVRRGCRLTSG